MPQYGIKGCPICAWRGTCVMKHRFEAGTSQNCVEFTRDMTLTVGSSEKKGQSDSGNTNIPGTNQNE